MSQSSIKSLRLQSNHQISNHYLFAPSSLLTIISSRKTDWTQITIRFICDFYLDLVIGNCRIDHFMKALNRFLKSSGFRSKLTPGTMEVTKLQGTSAPTMEPSMRHIPSQISADGLAKPFGELHSNPCMILRTKAPGQAGLALSHELLLQISLPVRERFLESGHPRGRAPGRRRERLNDRHVPKPLPDCLREAG